MSAKISNYLNASIPKDYKMGYYSKITLHVRFSLDVISLHVIFSRMLQLFETEKASIASAGHEIFAHFAAFFARKKQGLPCLGTIYSRMLQLFSAETARIASSGQDMFTHFAAFSRGKSKDCLEWTQYFRAFSR